MTTITPATGSIATAHAPTRVVVHSDVARTGAVLLSVAGSTPATARVGRRSGMGAQPVPVGVAAELAVDATRIALAAIGDAAGDRAVERVLAVRASVAVDATGIDVADVLAPAIALLGEAYGADAAPVASVVGVASLPGGATVGVELEAALA